MRPKTPKQSLVVDKGLIQITNGTLLDEISWVMKAICKNKNRYVLCNLHVEADCIVCTDGKRLHALHEVDHGIPVGSYEIISKSQSCLVLRLNIVNYPNWRQVVPSLGDYTKTQQAITKDKACFLIMSNKCAASVDFVTDAVRGTEMYVYVNKPESPIVLKSDRYTAIIMPLRLY